MRNKTKVILIAVILTLALLIGVAAAFLSRINNPAALFEQEELPTQSAEPIHASQSTGTPAPAVEIVQTPEPTVDPMLELENNSDPEFMKKRVNILVLGLDRSAERQDWGSFRTDTMILVSVNFDDAQVHMISIPRDSYIPIYGKEERNKANTAFAAGGGANKNGYEYAMGTVSQLFGDVPVNYYVGFDMQVVKDVVNAMGGVDYDVDVEVNMNGRTLSPGFQHLDGQAVLDYCRQRKGSSDIARVKRQQNMLKAIFGQLKSTSQLANIPRIYSAVSQNIDTNLSLTQISSLALFATKLSGTESILAHTLEGGFLNMNGISYWGVSQSKKAALVKEVFGKRIEINEEDDIDYIKAELEKKQKELEYRLLQAGVCMEDAQQRLLQSINQEEIDQLNMLINELDMAVESQDALAIDQAVQNYCALYVVDMSSIAAKMEGYTPEEEQPELPDEDLEELPDESLEELPEEGQDGLIEEE